MVGCELDVNLFWLVDVLRDGSLDDPAVNTYRIFLEIFPNDGSSFLKPFVLGKQIMDFLHFGF